MKSFFCILLFFCIGTRPASSQATYRTLIDRNDSARQQWLSLYLHTLSADSFEGRNTATKGQKMAAAYIVRQLESFGLSQVCRDSNQQPTWFQQWTFAKKFGDSTRYEPFSENIIGMIPSALPSDEYLVISAHYDHLGIRRGEIYNGADDNGTGTSAVLAMARELSGMRPYLKKNILIIFFSGEEKGLLGSAFFAKNPVFPMNAIFADLNIDMIGRADSAHQADSNFIYVIGSDKISPRLDSVLRATNNSYYNITLDYKYNDEKEPSRLYYRSDHYNFAKFGVPIIFFFSGLHADYHKPTDDPEHINFPRYHQRVKMILATALELQQLPGSLR